MNKTLAVLATTVGLAFSGQTLAALFTIDESSVGSPPNSVTADRLEFSYSATFNQVIAGGNSFAGGGDTFTETGRASITGFSQGGVAQASFINSPEPIGYKLNANFTAAGEADFFNGVDLSNGVRILFSSFNLDLWADLDSNGTDDVLLGSATLAFAGSEAHVFAGLGNGDFDLLGLFTTTAAGDLFFIDPNPFYINFEMTGVNTEIAGIDPVNGGDGTIDGSGNAFFSEVPEPATLALLGASLVGFAAARRRKA